MRLAVALVCCIAAAVHALEARWTPASDGGPARFSKKYRDAAGIDDSKWTNDNDDASGLSLFPTTPMGWAMAAVLGVVIFVMLGQRPPQPWQRGERVGAGVAAAQPEGPASEAARASADLDPSIAFPSPCLLWPPC